MLKTGLTVPLKNWIEVKNWVNSPFKELDRC